MLVYCLQVAPEYRLILHSNSAISLLAPRSSGLEYKVEGLPSSCRARYHCGTF